MQLASIAEVCDAGPMNAQHVTTKPAAQAIGVHPATLWRYYRKGLVVPAWVTPGGHLRWDIEDLKRQINDLPGGLPRHGPHSALPHLPVTEAVFIDGVRVQADPQLQ
jgi:hypothetical protein